MVSETPSEDTAVSNTINQERRHNGAALDSEKAVSGLANELPVVTVFPTRDSAKQVTIRQVAPLVLILTGATFITTASNSAVIIILPVISRKLSIPSTRQEWIVSTFALTSGSFLLLCGKLGDVYGKRVLFIGGSLFITATSLGSAFSPTELCFYVMRALQGLGCAITVPTAIGIIGYTIPPGRTKTYSFAFFSGGAPMGQVLGNLLAGVISQYASWKVVFCVLGGASFLVGATAIFVIPKEPQRGLDHARSTSVDWIGAFMFTSGSLLLLTGMSEGVSEGWKKPYVIVILVISVLSVGGFVYWQLHLERKGGEPLMKVSVFRNAKFSASMVTVFFFSGGFTNYLIYSTYFYQDYQLLSTIQTTLRYIPLGIVGLLSTLLSGYLLPLAPGNYIVSFGLFCAFLANLLFALPIPPSTSYFAYGLPAMCLAAFGADTVYPCLGLFTTQALPRRDQGVAGGMFQTVAAMGRALTLPITAAVQKGVQEGYLTGGVVQAGGGKSGREKEAFLMALRAAEWACVGFMLVALLATVVGLRGIGRIGGVKSLGEVEAEVEEEESGVERIAVEDTESGGMRG